MNILFRVNDENKEEFQAAIGIPGIDTYTIREAIPQQSTIIGRYSVLPFYKEQEIALQYRYSNLINSYHEHQIIANFEYYHKIKNLTPETWFHPQDIPDIPLVVKGRTNSKKYKWSTLMYANDRVEAIRIFCDLLDDPLISDQGIIFRRFEKFKVLEYGINDQPFLNEHRVFFLNKQMVDHGFYWVQSEVKGNIDSNGLGLALEAANRIPVPFIAVDVAQKEDGSWRVIEVNDGQMAGLSDIPPERFYSNLLRVYNGHKKIQ